jgi:glyoxylase-like metal-dependent hydrolase (beta-lactamase superfamily II)
MFHRRSEKAGVSINYVIDTHVHADHNSGSRRFAQMVGASYCLYESDKGLVKFAFKPMRDGQLLDIGNVEARCCIARDIHMTAFACWCPTNDDPKNHGL